jgi:hypothetical protein
MINFTNFTTLTIVNIFSLIKIEVWFKQPTSQQSFWCNCIYCKEENLLEVYNEGWKLCKSCHILRKIFQKLSYLHNEFLEIARKTYGILKNLYFANVALAKFGSFLLWMDDCQSTLMRKLKNKNDMEKFEINLINFLN